MTAAVMLPVNNGSPANLDNLYTALKEADKLRESIYCDGKTIVTFDLQLYIKAIQLQEVDIKSNFVFRMGELHVVFCVLKVIGKVMDGRRLDQAFEEAGKITNNGIKIEIHHSCLTNISSINRELLDYNQEEADTGIVLHALDVSKNDPFTE